MTATTINQKLIAYLCLLAMAGACSTSSKKDSPPANPPTKDQNTKSGEVKPVVTPQITATPTINAKPALDGWWTLKSYSCLKGTLTKSALLENALLSDTGIEVDLSALKIVNGTSLLKGKGKVTRRFEWTIEGNQAERKTKLILNAESGESGIATVKKRITLTDITAESKQKMHNIPEGGQKLQLVHGIWQNPAINGIDVSQVAALLATRVADANSNEFIENLKITPLMKDLLKGLSGWFAKQATSLSAVTSAVEAIIERGRAKETITVTFGQGTMAWTDSQLQLEDSLVTDINVLDNAMCGADGKMARNFARFNP